VSYIGGHGASGVMSDIYVLYPCGVGRVGKGEG